jgi:hypothetical protein
MRGDRNQLSSIFRIAPVSGSISKEAAVAAAH